MEFRHFLNSCQSGTQFKITGANVSERVFDAVVTVCEYLYTESVGKSHGCYHIYEDEKIVVRLDTYVPNIAVFVKFRDGEKQAVLLSNYSGDVSCYKPGAWEKYLQDVLWPKAQLMETLERQQRADGEAMYRRVNFDPIDDDAIFS